MYAWGGLFARVKGSRFYFPTVSRATFPGGPLPPPDNNNINKKNTENKRLGRILERLGVVFLAFISYFRVQKNTGFLGHV